MKHVRVYSNIFRISYDGLPNSMYVGSEPVNRISDVKVVKNPNAYFPTELHATHRNTGDVYRITQLDRRCFWMEGRHFSGEVKGFADAVRLLNNL